MTEGCRCTEENRAEQVAMVSSSWEGGKQCHQPEKTSQSMQKRPDLEQEIGGFQCSHSGACLAVEGAVRRVSQKSTN